MSQGINSATLIGNLGKAPEVRYTQTGKAVCNLRLAVTERKKDGDDWRDHTEWLDIVCFEKNAENAGQYLDKGSKVYVEGKIQTRKWQDKEGKDRYSTEILANRILFLDSKGDKGGEKPTGKPAEKPAESGTPNGSAAGGFIDDDLPF
jgi:single-strand DNA-binding protein